MLNLLGPTWKLVLETQQCFGAKTRERLERHIFVSLVVVRFVHNPHTAGAELALQLEAVGSTKVRSHTYEILHVAWKPRPATRALGSWPQLEWHPLEQR